MNNKSGGLEKLFDNYLQLLIRWKWVVLILCLFSVIAANSSHHVMGFNNDYKVYFSPDNPQLQAFEALQKVYTKNDNILFVIESKDGAVFTKETLSAIKKLTNSAWEIPYSSRVDSITNFQYTDASDSELIVRDLVTEPAGLTEADLAKIKEITLSEPFLVNQLINPEGSVTAVNVTLYLPLKDMLEIPSAVSKSRELAASIEAEFPQLKVRLAGYAMLNNAFVESSMSDMSKLVPIMYLLIVVVTAVLLRSIPGVIATGVMVVFSISVAMGCAAWLGYSITPPLASAPTIIMTLAIADSIHIFLSFFKGMREGMSRNDALLSSLKRNVKPVFLTSITTAIGFLTLNSSEAPPFRDLGNVVAIGVTAAWFYSMTLVPALIAVLPIKSCSAGSGTSSLVSQLGKLATKGYKIVILTFVLIAILTGSMIFKNQLDDEFIKYFDHSIQFRNDVEYTSKHLTGVYQLQYSLPANQRESISNPEYLNDLDTFVSWLRSQNEVVHVNSVTDILKRINRNMHANDDTWYRLPENRELTAQYLLMYELSLPYGLDMNNQININKDATQVMVTVKDLSSTQLKQFAEKTENWLRQNTPMMLTYAVGPSIMFAHVSAKNIESMLYGTLIGLVLISVILVYALGDLRIGLLSLVTNLLPIVIALGIWGLFVGQINLAVSVVVGMTFGIVVDDTIHLLNNYIKNRKNGMETEDAIDLSLRSVGPSLLATTVILAAGFTVLSFSSFAMNADMAKITVITIVAAFFVDFLMVPSLLILGKVLASNKQAKIKKEGLANA